MTTYLDKNSIDQITLARKLDVNVTFHLAQFYFAVTSRCIYVSVRII